MPRTRDALTGLRFEQELAAVQAQAGDIGGALATIQRLLEGPGYLSVHDLRLNPVWDPLRSDQRFQRLLAQRR